MQVVQHKPESSDSSGTSVFFTGADALRQLLNLCTVLPQTPRMIVFQYRAVLGYLERTQKSKFRLDRANEWLLTAMFGIVALVISLFMAFESFTDTYPIISLLLTAVLLFFPIMGIIDLINKNKGKIDALTGVECATLIGLNTCEFYIQYRLGIVNTAANNVKTPGSKLLVRLQELVSAEKELKLLTFRVNACMRKCPIDLDGITLDHVANPEIVKNYNTLLASAALENAESPTLGATFLTQPEKESTPRTAQNALDARFTKVV